ncbi:MAG: VCBS repeat-containing protein, partial [Nitrospirae bacterium]|nr:VCBS repeat-containing protein [Nitrospirota bacterium]
LPISALATGDWDSDGNLDLAVANFSINNIAVLRNNGTGSFSSLGVIAGQFGISALVAGDWDGNGSLDLAAADNGSDSVHILDNQP